MTTMDARVARRGDETLDPATPAEWNALRDLGHRMVEDMLQHLRGLREQPVWTPLPPRVAAALREPVPRRGQGAEYAYERFLSGVLPYSNGNRHPRFWGWVMSNGTPLAMLADMLAAGMNAHLSGFSQAPVLVEEQVLAWFAELLGMPGASGVMVTGGSMANVLGLAVARVAAARAAGLDVREAGHQSWPGERAPAPMVFYGSAETHGWARKAAELLGLGDRAYRRVPCGGDYRIHLPALAQMIARDRAQGLVPAAVVGTAGTVNTGASDDLRALADLCRAEGIWLHVDGAFGALAYLSDELRPQVAGLELADSIAFDLHKWGYMPFECACVLIREPEHHRAAFAASASYLAPFDRGVMAGGLPFAERGMDLTRGFRALKVWMSIQAEGIDRFVRLMEQNVAHVRHLVARVDAEPHLELLAPAPLNVACFRFVAPGLGGEALNEINREILLRVQESGAAVPSSTVLGGRFALRVANVNHRTRVDDMDLLLDEVLRHGHAVAAAAARG
ncbi:MAG TPA: pyridoxal-dependent decarboxylase [Longimicrobium sp.]|jgi:glutamate/tyrosine decarboxylase-like PLP-dependent enzyme|uniref:pyridoxal phosphate-dependent decarboxylase family protein n=1 Tax=Longimicrobium sp. TaxID=2029185 RepID=UPI002ED7C9AB